MAGIILRGSTWHFRWIVPELSRCLRQAGDPQEPENGQSDSRTDARAKDYERELRSRFEA